MKKNVLLFLLIISSAALAQRGNYKNMSEKNGKIGIGTKTPDELLTVKGKIHTQEVRVDLKGAVAPDYVFETYFTGTSNLNPTYKLMSLPEVESYIKKHHHLPGIPSAKEIEENGLSLKQMNLLLLEKIEELTLYTLQQQKELDELKRKLNQN